MLRFASSPTRDMHIGDLRVALFNYLASKQRAEDLIVRIEDTNKNKNIDGKDKEILDILDLFGIRYTQTIYQSESARFHSAMALQLMHEKQAFSCFCSWEWIQKKQEEAKADKKKYLYDDACANLPDELVIDNLNPFTIRIKKPTKNITIKDHIKGKVTFKPEDMDSTMILKQDKTSTYEFASAVDDMLNDISLVIRDEDLLYNAPKEDYVRAALTYDKKVEYAHLPLISNDSSFSVKALLEEGFLPETISNYLISISMSTPKNVFTLEEAEEFFDLNKVSKETLRFDKNALGQINHEHLKMLDSKELSRYVGFADEDIGELAKVYLEEVSTTKELRSKIEPIFTAKKIPDELREQANVVISIVKSAPYFEKYDDFKEYVMKKSGIQDNDFVEIVRLILTGAKSGPDLAKIYKYLKNYIGEIVK